MKEQEITKTLNNIIGLPLFYGSTAFTLGKYRIDKDMERVYMTTIEKDSQEYDRPFNGMKEFVNELKPQPEKLKPVNDSLAFPESEVTPPTTFKDLRSILLDNIAKLQTGRIKLADAKEIANQAQTIINITKVEIEFHKNLRQGRHEKR
jgi:hypothetical protein